MDKQETLDKFYTPSSVQKIILPDKNSAGFVLCDATNGR
jgi:hypothetical protein